jgi:bifunctional ADP-heptose synthase (sugar kinase/adenylyltransferase)
VAIAPWPTGVEAIELVRPDIYVKGQDYRDPNNDLTGGFVAERRAVEALGGRVAFTDEIRFSSSKLLAAHFELLLTEGAN